MKSEPIFIQPHLDLKQVIILQIKNYKPLAITYGTVLWHFETIGSIFYAAFNNFFYY